MKEEILKQETIYSIKNRLGETRSLFISSQFKDHMALSDFVGEAMSGAFKKWYSQKELIEDLRATADVIEKFNF